MEFWVEWSIFQRQYEDYIERSYPNWKEKVIAKQVSGCDVWNHAMSSFNSLWFSDAICWHKSGSTLVQVMACCLMAPSHHLNQCWFIISEILWNSCERLRAVSQEVLKLLHWNLHTETKDVLLKTQTFHHLPGTVFKKNHVYSPCCERPPVLRDHKI